MTSIIESTSALYKFIDWNIWIVQVLGLGLILSFIVILIFRAVKLVVRALRAAEESAKAQQETVQLMRQLVALKSKEEKKS